jgi:hypothetical protein
MFQDNSMKSQWFYRVWTYQEIVVAKRAVVICGDQEIPWKYFLQMMFLADTRGSYFDWARAVENRLEIQKLVSTGISSEGSLTDTAKFLLYDNPVQASDPRDYVFGLQAIWFAFGINLDPPSYSKTVSQVFEEMTRAVIQRTEKLDVIWHIYQRRPNSHSLPSWVYDWQVRGYSGDSFYKHLLGKISNPVDYDADASYTKQSRHYFPTVAIPGQLAIFGRLLGKVNELWDQLPSDSALLATITQTLEKWTASASRIDEKEALNLQKVSKFSSIDSLASLLFGSVPSRTKTPSPEELAMWRNWTRSVLPDGPTSQRIWTLGYKNLGTVKELLDRNLVPALAAVKTIRPFTLDTGYVGLESSLIKSGDKIILAAGSDYPLAIRARANLYELVCPCPIAGIESGQAWHENGSPDAEESSSQRSEDYSPNDLQLYTLV